MGWEERKRDGGLVGGIGSNGGWGWVMDWGAVLWGVDDWREGIGERGRGGEGWVEEAGGEVVE